MASRHLARSICMQSLYEWDFFGKKQDGLDSIVERNIKEFGPGLDESNQQFVRNLAQGVIDHLPQLDVIIEKAAPELPLNQIPL